KLPPPGATDRQDRPCHLRGVRTDRGSNLAVFPMTPAINCAHDALVSLADLKPNPDNPNRHDKDQLALYAKILLHQGWRKPILVSNQSGFIVTGHGAWLTAKAQGWTTVPVDYQDFACKADEVAHMIADNKLAQM